MTGSERFGCTPLLGTGVAMLVAIACSSANPAAPEDVRLEEMRLSRPFEDPQIIVATEATMTITANFYQHLSQGVNAEFHDTERETKDGVEIYRFKSKLPSSSHMTFTFGNTQLVVEDCMELRVLSGRNDLTLDLSAHQVSLSRGGATSHLREIEIADGVFRVAR